MATHKTWWAPVWRGLVVDSEGKHYRKIKNALWLYLYLIVHANRRTGTLTRKCKTVAESMGLNEKTVRKWISTLRKCGYIETRSSGRATEIVIKRWKTFGVSPNNSGQSRTYQAARLPLFANSSVDQDAVKFLDLGHKTDDRAAPDDISIKENRLNDIFDSAPLPESSDLARDKTSFADELADALDDRDGYKFYLGCAWKYPENHLRRILEFVLRTPDHLIKRNRGAMFNALVHRTLSTTSSQKSPESSHHLNSFE